MPTIEEIKKFTVECIKKHFDYKVVESITENSFFYEHLDSLNMVECIMHVEDEYKIKIDDTDAEKLLTLDIKTFAEKIFSIILLQRENKVTEELRKN